MKLHQAHWGKTIFWGVATAALYAAMFAWSDLLLQLAHTTPDVCIVDQGGTTIYYHKADTASCAAMNGHIEPGVWWHVLIPILLAFAISIVHGAFTGLFWEAMGLKPAARAEAKE
ncbi:MAG: hypothetical protein Q8S20_20195 [Sulfuritalea sp.]|nr:hypothetical protein [Sulfuritalea sp.]